MGGVEVGYVVGAGISLVAWLGYMLNLGLEYDTYHTDRRRVDARDVWNGAKLVALVPVWPVGVAVLGRRVWRRIRRAVRAADEARARERG